MYNKIGVVGAGAFGTSLANALAKSQEKLGLNNKIIVYDRSVDVVNEINLKHQNFRCFGNLILNKNVVAVSEFDKILDSELLLLVIPSKAFKSVIDLLNENKWDGDVLICTKGLDVEDGSFLYDKVVQKIKNVSVLSGPSFAKEVAEGNLTWFSFAGPEFLFNKFSELVDDENFRMTRTDDVIGVQFAGVFKNIIAILMGILDGKNVGENTKACYLTLGFQEMVRLGIAFGAKAETFNMSAGIGDLILTATSKTSRNFSCGFNLANNNYDFSNHVLCEGLEAFYIIKNMLKQKHLNSEIIDFLTDYIK